MDFTDIRELTENYRKEILKLEHQRIVVSVAAMYKPDNSSEYNRAIGDVMEFLKAIGNG